eukprot:TRINITY_DN14989_c0_g1_i1.p1 TRINITY_DN14989_c0_g1~~TRINITY_DN14989_c0_g1_i1.p1  ORF type:complete len:445 (+),score=127.59 TRINITY_DN14989_c0_g1_i1:59-1393(+)
MEDVDRLMELAPEYASVCGSTQTDFASTVCFDFQQQPAKFADAQTIEKSLKRAGSHEARKAEKGCDEIAWLALEVTNRGPIGAAGGVDVLLKVLQRWMGKRSAVLQSGLTALGRLLTEEANAEAFYDYQNDLIARMEQERQYVGGGTILVAAAMSGYPLKMDLQSEGCAIARSLVMHELYLTRFLDHGMLGHVLAAMHRHPESSALAIQALSTIFTLASAKDGELRAPMAQQGVVLDYVSEALETHSHHSEVVGLAGQALAEFQKDEALLKDVRMTAAIPHALTACEIHGANEAVVLQVLEVLVPHVEFFPSRLDEFARIIKKAMTCSADPDVFLQCFEVAKGLARACGNDATKVRLTKHVVPYVAAALNVFDDIPDLQESAREVLGLFVINKWTTDLGKPRGGRRPPHAGPRAPSLPTEASMAPNGAPAPLSPATHVDPARQQ